MAAATPEPKVPKGKGGAKVMPAAEAERASSGSARGASSGNLETASTREGLTVAVKIQGHPFSQQHSTLLSLLSSFFPSAFMRQSLSTPGTYFGLRKCTLCLRCCLP